MYVSQKHFWYFLIYIIYFGKSYILSCYSWFKENDAAKVKDSENLDVSVLVRQFSTDVMSEDATLVQAALPAMGFCLNQAGILR